MNSKAQAGLEYLMTYGWALVLTATIIGVLIFVVSNPSDDVVFVSSDPTKLLMKASAVVGNALELKLQNITGGPITVTKVTLPTGYSTCMLNSNSIVSGDTTNIGVGAGGELFFECSNVSNASGEIDFEYRDVAGLDRTFYINASSSGTIPGGSCIDGATQACTNQIGVCSGSVETCTGGSWSGCTATEYGVNYEATETSCFDDLDNDCQNDADCADPACSSACTFFFDDMESGSGSWTSSGYWHLESSADDCSNPAGGDYSWYYGFFDSEAVPLCSYNDGIPNSGCISSSSIDLPVGKMITLDYDVWIENECGGGSCYYDSLSLELDDGSSIYTLIDEHDIPASTWAHEAIDLTPYAGSSVSLIFCFDTGDSCCNQYTGVYIDNVLVKAN